MVNIIDINTGEIKLIKGDSYIAEVNGIGSCIALAIVDFQKKICGIAHIMLPGSSNAKFYDKLIDTRFSKDAIDELLKLFSLYYNSDFLENDVNVCLAGGSNVLERSDDYIANENINSVLQILQDKKIEVRAYSLGGIERRTITVNLKEEKIYYTIGDSRQRILFCPSENICAREFIQNL